MKRVARDAEDRRDRVDGEDHVGRLDDHQHQQQRRRPQPAVLADEEALAAILAGERHEALEGPHDRVRLGVDLRLSAAEDLEAGVEQEGAEDEDQPCEAGDQRRAHADEQAAGDQGAEDAPEQHPVLVLRRHGEVVEDDDEDEEVVEAERPLDDVGGQELDPDLVAEALIDPEIEGQGDGGPDDAPETRLAQPDPVLPAVEDPEVERQHPEDQGEEEPPVEGGAGGLLHGRSAAVGSSEEGSRDAAACAPTRAPFSPSSGGR